MRELRLEFGLSRPPFGASHCLRNCSALRCFTCFMILWHCLLSALLTCDHLQFDSHPHPPRPYWVPWQTIMAMCTVHTCGLGCFLRRCGLAPVGVVRRLLWFCALCRCCLIASGTSGTHNWLGGMFPLGLCSACAAVSSFVQAAS